MVQKMKATEESYQVRSPDLVHEVLTYTLRNCLIDTHFSIALCFAGFGRTRLFQHYGIERGSILTSVETISEKEASMKKLSTSIIAVRKIKCV